MKQSWLLLTLVIAVLISSCYNSSININETTCNHCPAPQVVNTLNPLFGWQMYSKKNGAKQTGFQILVSTTIEKISNDEGDIWDTGKIMSDNSQNIPFSGKKLESSKRYYWKVRVWNSNDKVSDWSTIKHWDMGLSDISEWNSKWIGAIKKADSNLPEGHNYPKYGMPKSKWTIWQDSVAPQAKQSILLRKNIEINKNIKLAKIYIAGLGHYELTINGNKIGNDIEFSPLWSNYDKTVYYNVYDITDKLLKGLNTVGVLLGNGMYNVTGNRYVKFWGSYGPPTLLVKLDVEYNDGSVKTITTDETWKYINSPITFNCIYGGEDYDARLEEPGWNKPGFDDSNWSNVVLQQGPKGCLIGQTAPAVKIMEKYPVKKIIYSNNGYHLLDMGQNLSGFPMITVKGKKGQTIRLKVGEQIANDTIASQKQTGGPHYYQYTLKGNGIEEWHPRFSYYGFQYIQVEGANYKNKNETDTLPELIDIQSCFVHSSTPQTGYFECSSDLYSKVEWLINNSIKSNMQAVFTDCPHREKLGWLEESHLVGPGILYTFNASPLLAKIERDMADAQTADGLIPNIAPEYINFGGVFRETPEWGSSSIINPWLYYQHTGDNSLIKNYYPVAKKYFNYLVTKSNSLIIEEGLGDWYDFGKQKSGFSQNTPVPLPATAYLYYDATLLSKAAKLLGHNSDIVYFDSIASEIKKAYNNRFFNSETNQYSTGSQASNAISLYMGLVDSSNIQAVINNLLSDIKNRGYRLTTGDVGNRYLFQTLAMFDKNDIVYKLTHHNDIPGYGYQLQYGLTTLTENWDPKQGASWNHFMMGQIKEWFYKDLAGINAGSDGFKHIIFKPSIVGDINWVLAKYLSPYGLILSNWEIENNTFRYRVDIPVNCTATIYLPKNNYSKISVNNELIKDTVINIGSGTYIVVAEK